MPKGQRQSRNQGIYRQSPMVPTSSSQYLPHNMARSHSHMNYYATPGDMLQQSQGQQQSTYNVYSQGGPVQPMNYVSLPAPLSTLPIPVSFRRPSRNAVANTSQTLDVPISLRASSGAWAAHDDHKLMQARAQGLNWAPIQQKFFPNKTANACRKRHERLMEKRNSDEWDSVKLERLGAAYNSMRKEIWQQLAEACGEKWQVVEQKVKCSPLTKHCEFTNFMLLVHVDGCQKPATTSSRRSASRTPLGPICNLSGNSYTPSEYLRKWHKLVRSSFISLSLNFLIIRTLKLSPPSINFDEQSLHCWCFFIQFSFRYEYVRRL